METSIISETISQHTMCENSEGSYTEANKNRSNVNESLTSYLKPERFILSTFHCRKWQEQKKTVRKQAMMGLPLVTLLKGRTSQNVMKGKTPRIGVKRLEWIKPKMGKMPINKRWFRVGRHGLWGKSESSKSQLSYWSPKHLFWG